MASAKKNCESGFTIVELLVVIVVIGILATFTLVGYVGVSNKAVAATLEADLSSASKQLKMFQAESNDNSYPETINCGIPNSATNLCLVPTVGNEFTYEPASGSSPKSFRLQIKNGDIVYVITESTAAIRVTAPIVATPTVSNIVSTGATMGADVTGDGGSVVTRRGTCWGTSPNPTTNCTDAAVGTLASIGTIATGSGHPNTIISSSDNNFIYTLTYSPATINIYGRNSSGILSSLGTSGSGLGGHGLALSPNGASLYQANEFSALNRFTRNTSTGALSSNGSTSLGSDLMGVAVSSDGKSVYTIHSANNMTMLSRDTSTGAVTNLGTIATGNAPYGIATSADGNNVYVTAYSSNNITIYNRDSSTSLLTNAGTIATGTSPYGIVVSPDDKFVYTVATTARVVNIYSRDTSTGALTSLGTIATGTSPQRISMTGDGKSVYVGNSTTISTYSRNTTTGMLTSIDTIGVSGGVRDLVATPNGDSVYSVNYTTNLVYEYARNKVGGGTGAFVHDRIGLPTGTTIYYRGYAVNSVGTGYSDDATFTTP